MVVFPEGTMTQSDPNDFALQALPIFFDGWDLNTDFTIIDGYYMPTRLIKVTLMPNVTIGEANSLIENLEGEIIGTFPGHPEAAQYQLGGLKVNLRVPERDYKEIIDLVLRLASKPLVFNTVPINVDGALNTIPKPNAVRIWEFSERGKLKQ